MSDTSGHLHQRSYSISISFMVGILLFLLPFAEIRCNNESFAQNSGVGLAFGTNYKITGQIKAFSDAFKNNKPRINGSTSESGKAYPSALIALLLGIAGLILSLVYYKSGTSTMIIASLAAISLVIMAFQLKADVSEGSKNENYDTFSNKIIVAVHYTIWYFLSVISFLIAAYLSYRQKPWDRLHSSPPKNAPQVPIRNPGEQSEFPTSPEETNFER